MSVLDLDFYKLTMLQFIWRHYADVPVTFRLHSRRQDLRNVVNPYELSNSIRDYQSKHLTVDELVYLRDLDVFDHSFLLDLDGLFARGLPTPVIDSKGVSVSGNWFDVTLWETVILSMVTENYSAKNGSLPHVYDHMSNIKRVADSGAKWVDFGTRRRFSRETQHNLVKVLAEVDAEQDIGFMGTSNVDLARRCNVKPTGTYAHELEMVLRPYFKDEFSTTRDVLEKWGAMYPYEQRIALTDTYTTPKFFEDHGRYLLDNNWRAVRLDSGDPIYMGSFVDGWMVLNRDPLSEPFDVVFSDGLDADTIVELQQRFHGGASYINPMFGWGTGFTNPNSDLSLVMKAVESNGQKTYKTTDDNEKSIR